MTGCAYLGGGTDLSEVAERAELANVTTGDGTFENYTATGHHSGIEIGIGLGLGTLKLMEFFPAASNEDLLANVAKAAKKDGAENMINVRPQKSIFIPLLIIIGPYVDMTEGTGIKAK